VSKQTKELWRYNIQGNPGNERWYKICGPDDERLGFVYSETIAKRLIADHNAWLQIPNPSAVMDVWKRLKSSTAALLHAADYLDTVGSKVGAETMRRNAEENCAVLTKLMTKL